MSGRAWVFGDFVCRADVVGDRSHCDRSAVVPTSILTSQDPQFARSVSPGDFLVAGTGFGHDIIDPCIARAFKDLGLGALVARSFGAPFARQAIQAGLPALVVEETAAIKTGDRLRVDVEGHVVANLSSGDRYVIRNIDDESLLILRAGGLRPDERPREAK